LFHFFTIIIVATFPPRFLLSATRRHAAITEHIISLNYIFTLYFDFRPSPVL